MKGKLIATATLAAVMALGLGACGKQEDVSSAATGDQAASTQTATTGEFATLGDVFARSHSDFLSVYDESSYTCAFCVDDTYYRITAEMPEGLYDSLSAVELGDSAKIEELLSTVAVKQEEVIAEGAPTQEELDALAGKTGAELAAEGYVIESLTVNDNATDCSAHKNPFAYLITFEGAVADENTANPAGAVKDLPVTAVSFQGLSSSVLHVG